MTSEAIIEEKKRRINDNDERIKEILSSMKKQHDGQNYDHMEEDHYEGNQYEESEEEYLAYENSILSNEIREIQYNDEKSHRLNEISKLTYNSGYMIHDSESESDLLSRAQHAEELSRLIAHKKTLSPLTLGIYGSWGEGKSSFLGLIESELKKINLNVKNDIGKDKKYNQTHVIRFDASEYNDQDKIWFSMLNQLFAKYEEEEGLKAKLKYGCTLFKKSFRTNRWNYIINIITLLLFIFWVIVYTNNKSVTEVLMDNDLIINILGIISTVTVATNIVMPLLKKIKSFSIPLSDSFISELNYPNYKDLLGTREKVKENLDNLILSWTKKSESKIVILVDELDRCSEKTIVEFFDALQLFLPIKSIIHVISINQETVCYALSNNNRHYFDNDLVTNEAKIAFGMDYLEKYITVPYHLPYGNNYDEYINNILVDDSGTEVKYLLDDTEKGILIGFINEISKSKHVTPREIKKIINLLLLSKERLISINKAKKQGPVLKLEEYIGWFLFKYFFPQIGDTIIEYLKEPFGYNYNINRTFGELKYESNKDYKENLDFEVSRSFLKYLNNTRIEYINISNELSRNLIL